MTQRRVTTGIKGLDEMLNGGFVPGSMILVRGAPGTGKTSLALQFLIHGAAKHDEAGLLPDQAVDVRRIDAALRRLSHHGRAERHRKPLHHVDFAPRAIAGIDAAIPDAAVAGELRRREQLAKMYDELLDKYSVTIESPASQSGAESSR